MAATMRRRREAHGEGQQVEAGHADHRHPQRVGHGLGRGDADPQPGEQARARGRRRRTLISVSVDAGLAADELRWPGVSVLGVARAPRRRASRPARPRGRRWRSSPAGGGLDAEDQHGRHRAQSRPAHGASRARSRGAERGPTRRADRRSSSRSRSSSPSPGRGGLEVVGRQRRDDGVAPLDERDAARRRAARPARGRAPRPAARGGTRRGGAARAGPRTGWPA